MAKTNKTTKPTPKATQKKAEKPTAKKAVKKDEKKTVKKEKDDITELKKKKSSGSEDNIMAKSKKEKTETKKSGSAKEEKKIKKGLKEEPKKARVDDEDIESEELDLDGGLLEEGLEVDTDLDDDDDDFEPDEPKRKGRKPKVKEVKKKYDSEDFVRKQVVKIDLSKSLLKKQPAEQPKPYVNTSDNRTRYSDKELVEFKELIQKKLEEAQADYDLLKQTLSHADDHGTDDTSPSFKLLEDGSDVLSKEETAQLASRQEKYIVNLKNALVRIENKSYGICRATGKLIPKERLRSVPHATLSIDAKLNQQN